MRQKLIVADLLARQDFAALRAFEVDLGSQRDILVRNQVTRQAAMLVFRNSEEVDRMTEQTDARLYGSYRLKRVYYSAFSPIPDASARLLSARRGGAAAVPRRSDRGAAMAGAGCGRS